MASMKLRNESKYEFTDISSEKYRVYVFRDTEVRIDLPQWLAVSENGHRVVDMAERSHYVPLGWVHVYWEVEDDAPHFVL